MSLLIKALKKAEQKHHEATALALEQVSLDPTVIAAANAAPPSVPTAPTIGTANIEPTALNLDSLALSIDEQAPPVPTLETVSASIEMPPEKAVQPASKEVRKEVQKEVQKEVSKPVQARGLDFDGSGKTKRWLQLGIATAVAVACAGGYLYWQTLSPQQQTPTTASSPLALDLAQSLQPKTSAVATKTLAKEPSTTQQAKSTSTNLKPEQKQVETKQVESKSLASFTDRRDVTASKAEAQVLELKSEAVVSIKPSSVPVPGPRLIRHDSNDKIAKLTDQAFAAQRKQDGSQAMQLYDQILELDKNSLDALLGKASLHAKNGDVPAATRLYSRVLELEPNDSAAKTALASLRTSVDPEGQESNLRNLLAKDPTEPSLLFALGNSLAAQGRWSEAQAVYFQAYSGDNQQPDYAFNLAISLERLRQNSLALNYYRSALELTQTKSARFKVELARQRIAALEKPIRVDISDKAKE
jgi:tetratricopeptide (TPR) repeat protein